MSRCSSMAALNGSSNSNTESISYRSLQPKRKLKLLCSKRKETPNTEIRTAMQQHWLAMRAAQCILTLVPLRVQGGLDHAGYPQRAAGRALQLMVAEQAGCARRDLVWLAGKCSRRTH